MKKIIIYLFFVSAVLGVSSCNGFLNPDRDNIYTGDKVHKHPEKAEGILLSAYNNLPGSVGFTDVATADAVSNNNGNSYRKITSGEWTSGNNPLSVWNTSYEAIAYINLFLDETLEAVRWDEDDAKNAAYLKRLSGEAKGLRAFYYIRLLEAHAGIGTSGKLLGVPMVMSSIESGDNVAVTRSEYDECVRLVVEDLDYAIKNLPVEYKDTGDAAVDAVLGKRYSNRMCGIIAMMLKARILYYSATPAFNLGNDTERWEKAAEAAAEVIACHGGLSALKKDRLAYYLSENCTDILWRKNYYNDNKWEADNFPPSLFGKGRVNPSQNFIAVFPMADGSPASGDAVYDYAGRDPRLDLYVIRNGSNLKNTIINTADGAKDGIDAEAQLSTRTGYYLRKMMNETCSPEPGKEIKARHFATLLRYTEAYLMYAEAACHAWGADGKGTNADFNASARETVAALRTSAGLPADDTYLASLSSAEELLDLIRNERRIELAFESTRFWDIRRWLDYDAMREAAEAAVFDENGNVTGSKEVESRKFEDYMVYGPIPYLEVRKGLEQNKGWK